MSSFKNESGEFILEQTNIETILKLIEPYYQQVQKEAKNRITNTNVVMPSTLQERHMICKPIDSCYLGFEQIIEKLQADLKILKNLYFGEQRFFDFLFPNIAPNEPNLANDKHIICQHYMNSTLRWFFLDISNLLESTIRGFCETNNIQPSSNRNSLLKKIKSIVPDEKDYEAIKQIITSNLDDHINFPRFLDQLNLTKNGTDFRNFADMLLKIRNSSHNGFYYGANLNPTVITAFNRTQNFIPGGIIDVNIYDIVYFLVNSIELIKTLESKI